MHKKNYTNQTAGGDTQGGDQYQDEKDYRVDAEKIIKEEI